MFNPVQTWGSLPEAFHTFNNVYQRMRNRTIKFYILLSSGPKELQYNSLYPMKDPFGEFYSTTGANK